MQWEEKEKLKDKYAGGTEYFLFNGDLYPPDRLITLLKAFSHFKKWQQSNMKLIMAGHVNKKTNQLKEKLATYKYRQDVIIIENPDPQTVQELTGAAYAPVSIDKTETELAKRLLLLYKNS